MFPINKGKNDKGNYRAFYSSIWNHLGFRKFSPNEKLVFFYLRTSPLCNIAGIYEIYIETIHKHTGLSEGAIKDAIENLKRADWIEHDDDVIWIKNALQYDPGVSVENEKHLVRIKKILRSLPKLKIVDEFRKKYKISSDGEGDKNQDDSNEKEPAQPIPKKDIERLVNLWNVVCGKALPKAMTVTDKRISHINARLNERPDFEFWTDLFKKIAITPFLLGENNGGWKANFDWVMNPNNLVKIVEGNWPTTKEKLAPKQQPSQQNTSSLWENCKKCKKESLKANLNQDGLCFNCNPEAANQSKRLQELMKNIGKTVPSIPSTTLSKPEEME